MNDQFHIYPVGAIKKKRKTVNIEIYDKYRKALLGLDGFSHIIVCYWFHENDTPEKRNVLHQPDDSLSLMICISIWIYCLSVIGPS